MTGIRHVVPLIRRAIAIFGGQADGMFTTAGFQQATRAEFRLRDLPDSAWCVRVLRATPGVTDLPPGGCYWTYRP